MIAAVVVFVAGIALAIVQPGDLGGKTSTNQASSSTTKPSSTGSTSGTTTGSTTGTTTGTSVPGTTVAPQSGSSGSQSSTAPTTPTTAKPATTTTTTPGGLGQGGVGGGSTTHPITGGTSMLALGLVMIAAAFALRRFATA